VAVALYSPTLGLLATVCANYTPLLHGFHLAHCRTGACGACPRNAPSLLSLAEQFFAGDIEDHVAPEHALVMPAGTSQSPYVLEDSATGREVLLWTQDDQTFIVATVGREGGGGGGEREPQTWLTVPRRGWCRCASSAAPSCWPTQRDAPTTAIARPTFASMPLSLRPRWGPHGGVVERGGKVARSRWQRAWRSRWRLAERDCWE